MAVCNVATSKIPCIHNTPRPDLQYAAGNVVLSVDDRTGRVVTVDAVVKAITRSLKRHTVAGDRDARFLKAEFGVHLIKTPHGPRYAVPRASFVRATIANTH